jgi:putative flippase GtrA
MEENREKKQEESVLAKDATAKETILTKEEKKQAKALEKKKISMMSKDDRKAYKLMKKEELREQRKLKISEIEDEKIVKTQERRKALADITGVKGGWLRFWFNFGQTKFCQFWRKLWTKWCVYAPNLMQFVVFLMLSNGVTVYQMILTVILQAWFQNTNLVNQSFRILGPIAKNYNGTNYYLFDYYQGLPSVKVLVDGVTVYGKGGLAYFLAFLIPLATAQIINYFAQRNITFKSKSNPWIAAFWYLIAWVAITLISNALLGLYQAPLYTLLSITWGWGQAGETVASLVVSFIQCLISFWVFFPIFKFIFPSGKKEKEAKSVK